METLVVLLVGVLATLAISHYYFRRTVKKRLSVYLILRNRVLAGIDPIVRQQLKFHFGEEEVTELYQIEFIVANDGERAVSGCIEPLSLKLPKKVKLLDSSILHRNPKDLTVTAAQAVIDGVTKLQWSFPLLNKADFFVVKLLLSGEIEERQLEFHILADDLPRTLKSTWLPPEATKSEGKKIEWAGVIVGTVLVGLTFALAYCCYVAAKAKPWIVPYPWATFKPSWIETPIVILAASALLFFGFLGGVLFFGMGLEGFFRRHPKFPLPSELRGTGYRLMSDRLAAETVELSRLEEEARSVEDELAKLKSAEQKP